MKKKYTIYARTEESSVCLKTTEQHTAAEFYSLLSAADGFNNKNLLTNYNDKSYLL